MVTIGIGCAGGELHHNQTYMDLTASSTVNGIVECACIFTPQFVYSSVVGKVKIFRSSGSNYVFVDEESITLYPNQAVIYPMTGKLSIQIGDFIGLYAPAAGGFIPHSFGCQWTGSSTGAAYRSGDITTTSLKTSWSSSYYSPSVLGYFSHYVKTNGLDTATGLTWATAWKTINKAATTVTDGMGVHIGFGTYNQEPANNKIAPQNVGTAGIRYICETAGSSGGAGTVKIEKNP